VDLHALFKGGYIVLGKRGVTVVLLNMKSTLLVEREFPAVATVKQQLEGR
jgi:hypothetical protein